jgi:hypothetical protein
LGVLFICLSGITAPLMNGFAELLGKTYSWHCQENRLLGSGAGSA